MFKRLRNRFIIMTMVATTVIVTVSFSMIFAGSALSQQERSREAMPPEFIINNTEIENKFRELVEKERKNHLATLGSTLIIVGVSIEILMFIFSYVYAEHAIEPVKRAYEQQRDFIANASHELKTPIAAIQANFEALGAEEEPWVSNIDTELTHANQLVLDLLTLARTGDIEVASHKKKADLVKTLRAKIKTMEARLDEKKLSVEAPEKLEVETYVSDFEQIAGILIDNAIKYSKSKILIKLSANCLVVNNDGKTIPKEKLERVFDRFYQVDKTNNGTGLGLAIAKATADKHNWQLTAMSEKGEIEFRLRFK